jgi:hypothetical protein
MSRPHRITVLLTASALVAGFGTWLVLVWLERQYADAGSNYSLIEPRLFMGGLVRDPPRGTGAALNLCEQDDAYRCTVHRWEAIPDTAPAPELGWLRKQVEFIEGERKAGHIVYVHCRNGVSRSGMVVIAYLMFEHGWTRDEALAFARSRRPIVRPNLAFMERLSEWEAELAATTGQPSR